MGYFPFFMDLEGKPGLLVGGGTVALGKAEKLLPFSPRLTVAAPEIDPGFRDLPGVELVERAFQPSDLDGAFFAVAASDDRVLNHWVAALCRERGVLVNVVDDREACTFLFPALVRRGSLTVGVSTGGASPAAAVWLKERISALLPQGLEDILSWLEELRPVMKERVPKARRGAVFAGLFSACLEAGRPLEPPEREEFWAKEGVDWNPDRSV